MAYRGDVMACEVEFDEAKYGTIPIVFFKNSQVVERSHMKYTAGRTELFPYVAMGFKGIRVLAKVPHLPPIYFELNLVYPMKILRCFVLLLTPPTADGAQAHSRLPLPVFLPGFPYNHALCVSGLVILVVIFVYCNHYHYSLSCSGYHDSIPFNQSICGSS